MPCTTSRVSLSTRTDIQIRNAGRQEKKVVEKPLLFSCFPDSFRLPFMDHKFVPVRVPKLCHPANRRLSFFDIEGDTALFELRDGSIDIVHFEGDCRSITRGFPSRMTTNSNCGRAKVILDPRALHRGMARLELKRLLIKFPCAIGVAHSNRDESYFVCNHLQIPFSFSGFNL